MRFLVGVAIVALAGLAAPAMAQTAAPSGDTKPSSENKKVTRMACKNEAVTGSFTRKARQCRHAVTTTEAVKAKSQEAARVQPAPATAPPAATEGGETKGQ